MKPVYVIGFMGSGKTSVSKLLSDKLGVKVVDTDLEIERRYQKEISSIFREEGEKEFRTYETNILQYLTTNDTIISTGGGIVESKANRLWMKNNGVVVYLHASWEETSRRLQGDTTRPLWEDQDKAYHLFLSRQELYEEAADVKIQTDQKKPEEIANEIITFIKMQTKGSSF